MDLNKIKNKSDNFYSKALFVLGWIIIGLGTIGSFVIASSSYEFSGTIFFACILSVALAGFLILGLAEIISILNDNRRLLAAMTQGNVASSPGSARNSIAEELPEL